MRAYWSRLSWRGRATYLAHLYKACVRQHHRELLPLLRKLLPPDGVVLDVGAHGGQFAKLFARVVHQGSVHAFEPSGYARSILQRALAVNRLANVTVHPFGLSDAAAELTLKTPIKRSGSAGFGIASFARDASPSATISERVEVRRLDDVWPALAAHRLDFLKADIEGWEMRLLAGGGATLDRFRPALLLEISPEALARAGDDADALAGFLEGLGYRSYLESAGDAAWLPGRTDAPADVLWLADRHQSLLEDGALRLHRAQ